ncbi:MAG: dethiobiotin synthase [Muribaculum sp.]|nr:dethiobiotin synthase [Muribaculum sp.]
MKDTENIWPSKLFITGIGTDVGKSYATGWLARCIAQSGASVITQKFIQTGNLEMSEDIEVHRRIMGIPLQTVDLTHITAPVIFTYPASPELAARIDGRSIDLDAIAKATEILSSQYSHVLIEGAGGIMVPVTRQYLTIDYIREHNLAVVLVTNGRLGSISDTLLNLKVIEDYGLKLFAVIWNPYFDKDKKIAADTHQFLADYLKEHNPQTLLLDMPS